MVPGQSPRRRYNSTGSPPRRPSGRDPRPSAAPPRPTGGRRANPRPANIGSCPAIPMEAFLVSMGVVALGEIGDKTQLLALMLAARFRRPLPIIAGILVATLANHALAGWLGNLARTALPPDVLRWAVALSFFAVALWALKPDTLDDGARAARRRAGACSASPRSRSSWPRWATRRRSRRWCSPRASTSLLAVDARHDARHAARRRSRRADRQVGVDAHSVQGGAHRRRDRSSRRSASSPCSRRYNRQA